jgi:hypothetical protein
MAYFEVSTFIIIVKNKLKIFNHKKISNKKLFKSFFTRINKTNKTKCCELKKKEKKRKKKKMEFKAHKKYLQNRTPIYDSDG